MSLTHSFSVPLAQRVGLEESILLNYFGFWHQRNETKGNNLRQGRYWTYNTVSAMVGQFPYWSEKQMRTLLLGMEKKGYLITDHFAGRDRTTWYALTDFGLSLLGLSEVPASAFDQTGKCILPNGQMQPTDRANPFDQTGNPNLPNGQMYNIGTVAEPITEPVTPPQNAPAGAGVSEDQYKSVGEKEKKGASTPSSAGPPSPSKPVPPGKPVPPVGDPFYRNRDVEQCNVKLSTWLEAYQVKGCNEETKMMWLALSDRERLKVMEHTPSYIASRPVVRKRRSPSNYLSLKEFNADIVDYNDNNTQTDPADTLGARADLTGKVYTQKSFN